MPIKNYWKQEYELGIEEIDVQHKYFFTLIKLLSKNKDQYPKFLSLFDELIRCTRIHTDLEKSMLEEYDYQNCEEHFIEHIEFIHKLKVLRKDLEQQHLNLSKVVITLLDWYLDHVTVDDRECIGFLAAERKKHTSL